MRSLITKNRTLLCIVLFALAIRIYIALAAQEPRDAGDIETYNTLAVEGGFGVCQAPFYPLLLRLVYLVFGVANLTPLFVIQGISSALVVPLLYFVASRTWGERAGIAAAVMSAVYPDFLFYNAAVHPESLIVLCVVSIMAIAVSGMRDTYKACAQGAFVGAGVLLQTSLVFLVPGVIMTLRKRLLFCIVCAAILAPWILRSSVVYRTFAPAACVSSHSDESIWKYAAAGGSLYRVADRMYVNVLTLYNWHPESPVIKVAGGSTRINGIYFVRKYSYLVLLLAGSFAAARYVRKEHHSIVLPVLICSACLVLLAQLSEGRFRALLEPLLILYASAMVALRAAGPGRADGSPAA
ncbi:MAG: glycosyltransferase family 39 protein [Candidatus Krumholzibacteriaceae bacterium]|jgi:4-amino-4-deoxy-L-arabinose transferase-like glycosyltransferase